MSSSLQNLPFRLALVFAGRELRTGMLSGLRGFRIFLACLAIGVAAIAGIGSLTAAVNEGLHADARLLLGGDVELRLPNQDLSLAERGFMNGWGKVSEVREQRAMLRSLDNARSTLIELKAVDSAYPLYGNVVTAPSIPLDQALTPAASAGNGEPGILVDPALLPTLNVAVGDRVRLGTSIYRIQAAIEKAPDSGASAFSLGAPAIVALPTLKPAGLDEIGTVSSHIWRLRLSHGTVKDFAIAARAAFPDATWQLHDITNASPGLRGVIEHVGSFLTLVGLTALLVGGIGIANAVSAHLASRSRTIATLKALGASSNLVFATYLIEILGIASVGILLGLAAGASVPLWGAMLLGDKLPIVIRHGLYPAPLLLAALFGVLTTLIFSLWPLGASRDVSAALLLRTYALSPLSKSRRVWDRAAIALLAVLLEAVVIFSAADRSLAAWFSLGAVGALLVFRLSGMAIVALARHAPRSRDVMLRQAIASLHRPGAATASIVMSLGLGLSVLVTVTMVQGALGQEVSMRIPAHAPSFFFVDIQPDELAPFEKIVKSTPGASDLNEMPNLRTRITALNGVPAADAKIDGSARPIISSERGLTYSAAMPAGSKIVSGAWWPADYAGPPEISLDAELAHSFHVKLGDTMTFDIAGREITARIANLRKIDWSSLGINFFTVFAPGALEHAPQTHLATVVTDGPQAERALQRAVTSQLPNVTAIRVRDALQRVTSILDAMAMSIRAVASITVASGILVLAGAVAAGQRRYTHDVVVLKVLGASRAMLLRGLIYQYAILGGATAFVAALFGTFSAWAILLWGMRMEWVFLPTRIGATAFGGAILIVAMGVAGTWSALNARPAPFLREI